MIYCFWKNRRVIFYIAISISYIGFASQSIAQTLNARERCRLILTKSSLQSYFFTNSVRREFPRGIFSSFPLEITGYAAKASIRLSFSPGYEKKFEPIKHGDIGYYVDSGDVLKINNQLYLVTQKTDAGRRPHVTEVRRILKDGTLAVRPSFKSMGRYWEVTQFPETDIEILDREYLQPEALIPRELLAENLIMKLDPRAKDAKEVWLPIKRLELNIKLPNKPKYAEIDSTGIAVGDTLLNKKDGRLYFVTLGVHWAERGFSNAFKMAMIKKDGSLSKHKTFEGYFSEEDWLKLQNSTGILLDID